MKFSLAAKCLCVGSASSLIYLVTLWSGVLAEVLCIRHGRGTGRGNGRGTGRDLHSFCNAHITCQTGTSWARRPCLTVTSKQVGV